MISMSPNQNVVVGVAGHDSGQNPAALSNVTVDIDNHALAYAVLNSQQTQVTVVTRGPLGAFNLTVNAKDASGNALPAVSTSFQSVAGLATAIVLTPGTPANNDITTPPIPAGW